MWGVGHIKNSRLVKTWQRKHSFTWDDALKAGFEAFVSGICMAPGNTRICIYSNFYKLFKHMWLVGGCLRIPSPSCHVSECWLRTCLLPVFQVLKCPFQVLTGSLIGVTDFLPAGRWLKTVPYPKPHPAPPHPGRALAREQFYLPRRHGAWAARGHQTGLLQILETEGRGLGTIIARMTQPG